jgi:hypothetical protein
MRDNRAPRVRLSCGNTTTTVREEAGHDCTANAAAFAIGIPLEQAFDGFGPFRFWKL